MEPIDWSKPIELMNGIPKKFRGGNSDHGFWIQDSDSSIPDIITDRNGCIGGVQVVRNRKEKRKLKVRGWVNVYTLDGSEPPYVIGTLYASLEGAKRFGAGAFASIYIDREVEEGEGL